LAAAAVIDFRGELVASTQLFSTQQQFATEPLFIEARQSQTLQTGLWIDGTRLLHIAIRPLVDSGQGKTYLLVGMPIGQTFADSIARIGATEVALVAKRPDGPLTLATTLEPTEQIALQSQLIAKAGSAEQRFGINYEGRHYDASVAPLLGSKTASLVALVASRGAMASFLAPGLPMIVGGLLVLLVVGLMSRVLWWRVVIPADDLTRIIDYAASSGDFHLTASERGAPPVAAIASAVNRLLARLNN
jgi:hypothetical protein